MTGHLDDREAILQALREGRRFLLLLHVRPDGDSIGSSLALARSLARLGKEAVVVRADDLPDNLRFLPGADAIRPWQEVDGAFDAAVFIDCGDLGRIGDARRLLGGCRHILNIDHHLSNARFGDLNYLEPEAAAAAEITYELIHDLGAELDLETAVALYVALVTDTGSFQYESTSPRTHRIAAALLEAGVRPAEVAEAVWGSRSERSLRLLGMALATLRVEPFPHGNLAWLEVTRRAMVAAGAAALDTEGFVNMAREVEGVELAVLFIEEGEEEVKVSFRSSRWLDVSRFAALFGGGGHARAAGCNLRGALAAVREDVLTKAREALREGPERWTPSSTA